MAYLVMVAAVPRRGSKELELVSVFAPILHELFNKLTRSPVVCKPRKNGVVLDSLCLGHVQ